MTKYESEYKKVDGSEEEEQHTYFKDLAHKCSRSKTAFANKTASADADEIGIDGIVQKIIEGKSDFN